jgi:acetoin reductase-like protein
MRLADKVGIVTGGGRGIGRGIALELAQQGAHVVVADLDFKAAGEVAAEIAASGRQSLALAVDVTVRSAMDAMVDSAIRRLGRLDILVNNAGVVSLRPLLEVTEEEWDQLFAVNLKGVLFGIQAAGRVMVQQRSGRIVNLSSIGAKRGSGLMAAYCASKAGVISLTRSAALALASYSITVNAVCPGVVETPMWERVSTAQGHYEGRPAEEVRRRRQAEIPLGRGETPEDVARVVAFLASDDAAYMTGQALNVCGGVVMH